MRERYMFIAASLVAAAALLGPAMLARAQSDGSSVTASASTEAGPEAPSGSPVDISEPAAPDWDRVEAAEAGSNGSQVLELPQVDPGQAKSDNGTDGGQESSQDGAEAADQIGSVDDYENQSAMTSAGVYPVPIPAGVGRTGIGAAAVPTATGMRAVTGPRAMVPAGPIIVRPGGLGPFPATSPMLTPPRGSGAIPGGWWTHTR
jgi:hypothetical protein